MLNHAFSWIRSLDSLAIIMILLTSYVGTCVISFSSRYLKGDKKYHRFLGYTTLLLLSVFVMVSSHDLRTLWPSSCAANFALIQLMIHKSSWKAAKRSGELAAKNYALSSLCLLLAFICFYLETGETDIALIIHQAGSTKILIGLLFLLAASMMQSAIWPFHRWLLSSLNSPTPISAMMHAGLINGGGFLLLRFAPLYLEYPKLLTVLFLIGLLSAFLGILWKLMQNDVKRMLACSTMGQMGFMFAQCGLGLFPIALSHLVWHSMFKAYLFLASGSVAQEKRFDLDYPPKISSFLFSLTCGVIGWLAFASCNNEPIFPNNTFMVIMCLIIISGTQLCLPLLRKLTIKNYICAMLLTLITGFTYGFSVKIISSAMTHAQILEPQPLNIVYIAGIIALILTWLCLLFLRTTTSNGYWVYWIRCLYLRSLNASQPDPTTITAHRNHYTYH